MSTPVFTAEGVSKRYVLRRDRSLALGLFSRGGTETFWALRDLDLHVMPGEVVAAVGRNGAGKSTLLKIAAGVTTPTTGRVSRPRAIAPLIEVGAGFHPDLSGRENVFVNARLLGIPAKRIAAKFDDIVAFAELGDAIDRPIRQYSSGMFMRLGFSVAVHTEPELLVVDEVLAVGDLPFQVRCLDRIKALRDQGAGVLFVSHNLTAVLTLADRALLLERGNVRAFGSPRDVVADYHSMLASMAGGAESGQIGEDAPPTDELTILSLDVTNSAGEPCDLWSPGERAFVRMVLRSTGAFGGGVVGFRLIKEGSGMVGAWHEAGRGSVPPLQEDDVAEVTMQLDLNVTGGGYFLDVAVSRADWSAIAAQRNEAYRFGVAPRENAAGLVDLAPTSVTRRGSRS